MSCENNYILEKDAKFNKYKKEINNNFKLKNYRCPNILTSLSTNNSITNKKYIYKKNKLEKLINRIGYNYIQYKNLFLMFLLTGIDGLVMTLFSNLIIPIYNYYDMNNFDISISSAIVFLGISFGNIFLKFFVNKFGRINCLHIAILMIVFSHFGYIIIYYVNFMYKYATFFFCIFRFITGIGNGLQLSIALNITCDKLPINYKGFSLSMSWMGFNCYQSIILIAMYIIMPFYETKNTTYIIILMIVLMIFSYIIVVIHMTDSPENLISNSFLLEAKDQIDKLLAIKNNKKLSLSEFNSIVQSVLSNVKTISKDGKGFELNNIENIKNICNKNNNDYDKDIEILLASRPSFLNEDSIIIQNNTKYCELNNKEKFREHISIIDISNNIDNIKECKNFSNMNNSYNLTKPLLEKPNAKHDLTNIFSGSFRKSSILLIIISLNTAIIFYGPLLITTLALIDISPKSTSHVKNNNSIKIVIIKNLIISITLIAANPLGGLICEIKTLGRKYTMFICYVFCLIANILLLIDHNSYYEASQIIILVFGGIAYNMVIMFFTELYPVKLRDTAVSFYFSINRVGGFVSQILFLMLVNIDIFLPYYVLVILLTVIIISIYIMPYDTI